MTSYEFKRKILPILIRLAIGLGIGIFVVIIGQGWLFELSFLKNIDLLTIDLRYQSKYERTEQMRDLKKDGDVVIVSISDKEDLKALIEPFPFPRSYYAHVIENLNNAGAKAIVFDITLQSNVQGDSILRETLKKYNNVVLATTVGSGLSNDKVVVRATEPTYDNVFYDVDKNIGVTNIIKDRDDVCRSYFPLLDVSGWETPTLGFAALNKYFKLKSGTTVDWRDDRFFILKDRKIPRNGSTFMLNYYGPDKTFRYVPFSQVIDDSTFETKDEFDIRELGEQINAFDTTMMKLFKNKIVILGSVMAEERDYHNVPLYREEGGKKNYAMNGVEIHATAIQNVIDKNFITTADPIIEIMVVLLLSLICFYGLLALKQVHLRHMWLLEIGALFLTVILVGAVFEVSIMVFSNSNILINVVNPSLAIVFAYFGTAVYQYLTERQQKAVIKNMFGHYINPAVVNELVSNPEKEKLGGDRRELTVFFSDIANFTTISEQYHTKPEGLVTLLNEFLDEMTRIVLKYEGTLDKYEGDAIMAFWGAPIPQKDHALRTCFAALDMQKRLEILRPKWIKEGKPPLTVRMGINTGIVIVGNMGGKDRFDYTVIGDSVNLSSRLEGANKQYKSNIMISDFTYTHVKSKVIVRELDLIQVKGKTEPVKVYELLGTTDMVMTENQKQALEMYHEGLKLYRSRKWEEAIAYMQQAYSLDESCYVAQIYTERANLYQLTPPPPEWNGVFIMTTK